MPDLGARRCRSIVVLEAKHHPKHLRAAALGFRRIEIPKMTAAGREPHTCGRA